MAIIMIIKVNKDDNSNNINNNDKKWRFDHHPKM